MHPATTKIIRALDKCTASGHWQSDIFDDWLDTCLVTLERMPEHLKAIRDTGEPAEDTPEGVKVWERLRERYKGEYYFNRFAEAFAILLDSTETYHDVIGEVYMEFGIPNKNSGQFFTPYPLARMLASVTVDPGLVYARIKKAYEQTPYGLMQRTLYGDNNPDARMLAFVESMGPDIIPLCAEYLEPITVNDCACGSGVMFLAAAEQFPAWVHRWGLVQFYGQDIDQSCVKMAKCNLMLYGLNGWQVRCALTLSRAELQALPQPYQQAYTEAQAATPERLIEITQEVRSWQQSALL